MQYRPVCALFLFLLFFVQPSSFAAPTAEQVKTATEVVNEYLQELARQDPNFRNILRVGGGMALGRTVTLAPFLNPWGVLVLSGAGLLWVVYDIHKTAEEKEAKWRALDPKEVLTALQDCQSGEKICQWGPLSDGSFREWIPRSRPFGTAESPDQFKRRRDLMDFQAAISAGEIPEDTDFETWRVQKTIESQPGLGMSEGARKAHEFKHRLAGVFQGIYAKLDVLENIPQTTQFAKETQRALEMIYQKLEGEISRDSLKFTERNSYQRILSMIYDIYENVINFCPKETSPKIEQNLKELKLKLSTLIGVGRLRYQGMYGPLPEQLQTVEYPIFILRENGQLYIRTASTHGAITVAAMKEFGSFSRKEVVYAVLVLDSDEKTLLVQLLDYGNPFILSESFQSELREHLARHFSIPNILISIK